MKWVLDIVVLAAVAPLAVTWALWLLFGIASRLPRGRKATVPTADGITIDLLIPAHNEESTLPTLLASLEQQSTAGRARLGNILVIADHCSDRTAELAREMKDLAIHVLERNTGPRGKPAALRDGIAWLTGASILPLPRRAVMIVDADCTLSSATVESTANGLDAGQIVLQAAYRLDEDRDNSGVTLQGPASIAFVLKNIVRPRGMARLGLPTQLFGTGMTFRADVLSTVDFRDHLTEDLAISYDLLTDGIYPVFVEDATVRSPLPGERKAMTTQKLRWETGQIQTWKSLPGMLIRMVVRGRLRAVVALLDWSALPLVMGVFVWGLLVLCSTGLFLGHLIDSAALLSVAAVLLLLIGYVLLGTSQEFGIAAVGRLLLATPRFCVWKAALYGQMVAGRGAKGWQRTPRAAEIAAAAGQSQE